MGVAALAVTLVIMRLTVNQLAQRKLKLSLFLFGGYVLFNLLLALAPATDSRD